MDAMGDKGKAEAKLVNFPTKIMEHDSVEN